jgi:ribonuclease HII
VDLSGLRVGEIKTLLQTSDEHTKKELLPLIETDRRKSVREIASRYKAGLTKAEMLKEEYFKLSVFERKLRSKGFSLIAGVDESGRGALAGPLVAAAVILPPDAYIPGLRDCKQTSPIQREKFYKIITELAISWKTKLIEPAVIDNIGLHKANLKALAEATTGLVPSPEYVLVDAFSLPPNLDQPHLGLTYGDRLSVSIAAASIISKVTRDRIMQSYHRKFPVYRFNQHKGYGTSEHLRIIKDVGPCPIHRRSFAGVE